MSLRFDLLRRARLPLLVVATMSLLLLLPGICLRGAATADPAHRNPRRDVVHRWPRPEQRPCQRDTAHGGWQRLWRGPQGPSRFGRLLEFLRIHQHDPPQRSDHREGDRDRRDADGRCAKPHRQCRPRKGHRVRFRAGAVKRSHSSCGTTSRSCPSMSSPCQSRPMRRATTRSTFRVVQISSAMPSRSSPGRIRTTTTSSFEAARRSSA